jgi:hypothetical protein
MNKQMEFPYTRICGIRNYIPPYFSIVNVNSHYLLTRQAHITRVLRPSLTLHTLQNMKVLPNVYSKLDAEWLGLISGIEYALENGETAIALEHSNLELMQGLIIPGTKFNRQNITYYKQQILTMTEKIEWLGARPIHTRQNRAINQRLY